MMPRPASSRAGFTAVLLLGGALVVSLAGCATPAGSRSASESPAPSPSPSDSIVESPVDAAWLDAGRVIGLVTSGSSTCIPAADEASAEGGVLTVTLTDPDLETVCTRDYVPRVTLVAVPDGVDPTQDLEITVGGSVIGGTRLAGLAGLVGGGETDYLPSAGWTGADGQFAILTWGSSGCRPVVQDVAATGPAEVTVTFATPPADQVCTADMAPRGVLASVTGLEPGTVELVLSGDAFDGVRVPILGTP